MIKRKIKQKSSSEMFTVSCICRSDRFNCQCEVYTTEFWLRCLTQKNIHDAQAADNRGKQVSHFTDDHIKYQR